MFLAKKESKNLDQGEKIVSSLYWGTEEHGRHFLMFFNSEKPFEFSIGTVRTARGAFFQ